MNSVQPPTPSGSANANPLGGSEESAVLQLTNTARASAGCPPVTMDTKAMAAAKLMSADMASRGYFSHTTPDGMDFGTRINKSGIQGAAAENIAKGQKTPAEVMDSWLGSAGHRANILNCSLTRLGVGVVRDSSGTLLWTQVFSSE